jgi:4-hydroxy-tetrahydrodipicolinate synthase
MPVQISKMIRLALNGDYEAAFQMHHALVPGMNLIFEEGNPAGIKAIFESLEISSALVRLPLVEASTGLKSMITSFVRSFAVSI